MTLTELTAGVPEKLLREIMEVVNVFELRQLVSSAKVKKKSEAAVARREELVDWVISAVLQKGQALADGGCRWNNRLNVFFSSAEFSVMFSSRTFLL
jgi:hydroxymethylpyrimidine/phosphomethylpyrimidine kinase